MSDEPNAPLPQTVAHDISTQAGKLMSARVRDLIIALGISAFIIVFRGWPSSPARGK